MVDEPRIETAAEGVGTPGGLLLRAAGTPFSYACHACGRCCHGRRISLSPYEVVRLAANRGLSTGALLERFATRDGTALRHRPDGGCVFLGERGCTVHPDRPLACRLYPLGAVALGDGPPGFVELEPHPRSEGVYGEDGTVGDYLASQGAEPYLRAAGRYRSLLARAISRRPGADSTGPDAPGEAGATAVPGDRDEVPGPDMSGGERRAWLDVDAVLAADREEADRPLPSDPEEKIRLHLLSLARSLGLGEMPGEPATA